MYRRRRAQASIAPSTPTIPGVAMSPLRVLTVDDEGLALRRMRLLLQSLPHIEHVGEANGCGEALVDVDRLRPDLVLLDVRMRDGSGFEVVEALAARPNPP